MAKTMAKLANLLISLSLLTPALLSANEQTAITDNKTLVKTLKNNTNTPTIKSLTIPAQLHGKWVLDQEASMPFAKTSPRWNETIAKLLPKLLLVNKDDSHHFTAHNFSMRNGDNSIDFAAEINPYAKTQDNTISLTLKQGEESTELVIFTTKEGLINIQGQQLLGYEFFLWKKVSE